MARQHSSSTFATWAHAKEIGVIGFIILCAAFLIWYICHSIHKKGQWKVYEPQFPQHIRTWYGYVERSKYERNAERISRYRKDIRALFGWKTTTADYEWMFWDPTGLKRKEYELKREQTFFRYLPRWMRSWEPQYLRTEKYRDVEQGVNPTEIFRTELPPRHDKACRTAQSSNQVDDFRSYIELPLDCPVVTSTPIESCDDPALQTIRRRKNTGPSPSAWHANSKETSRAICTQLLMPPKKTLLSITEDVQSEAEVSPKTLLSALKQTAQRAVTLPLKNKPKLENKEQMRLALAASVESQGKMHFALCGLDKHRGPEDIRDRPHNTEISTSHDLTKFSTAAAIKPFMPLKELTFATRSPVFLHYHRRIGKGSFGSKSRASNSARGRVITGGLLRDVSNQWRAYEAAACLEDSRAILQGSRQMSMSSFQRVVDRTRSSGSENVPLSRREGSRYASQSNISQESYHIGSLKRLQLGSLTQVKERKYMDDTGSPGKASAGVPRLEIYVHPNTSKICALTDDTMEQSLQLSFRPYRVRVTNTINSSKPTRELVLKAKADVAKGFSPAPMQISQQVNLRTEKVRPPSAQQSRNADPANRSSIGPVCKRSRTLPAKSLIYRPASVSLRQENSRQNPSVSDKLFVCDIYQRLRWLERELTPGFRQNPHQLPFLLDLGHPQPINMCGASPEIIKRRSSSLGETRSQSRCYQLNHELETERVPVATAMVAAAWVARQPPHGLPHDVSAEELNYYSRGDDVLRTLEDWHDPEGSEQPAKVNRVIAHDRSKGPNYRRQTISRSASLSKLAVKKLRRVGKLNVRRRRQNTARTSHQSSSTSKHSRAERDANEVELYEDDAHAAGSVGTARDEESTATQTPQDVDEPSDHSNSQDTERTSVTSTLLDGRELPKLQIHRDVKQEIERKGSQVSKEPWKIHTSQNAGNAYIISNSSDLKSPVKDSILQCTEDPFGVTPGPYVEHPLARFHKSYRSGLSSPNASAQPVTQQYSPNPSDVCSNDYSYWNS